MLKWFFLPISKLGFFFYEDGVLIVNNSASILSRMLGIHFFFDTCPDEKKDNICKIRVNSYLVKKLWGDLQIGQKKKFFGQFANHPKVLWPNRNLPAKL